MGTEYKIAIVGAGPAGYFAAQALQSRADSERTFKIDMIERLPTPWGLVRSGVAPDHPKIKTVAKVFEKIATTEGFRLFANVELGKDISLAELQENYDAVIVATGSSRGKRLGIPGEELRGSLSAADFVPWYNAHPDFVNVDVPLDTEVAIVIGAGNVAMDVGRMLALEPRELEGTDTATHALAALHKSSIRDVHIFGRRGPEHAAFTAPELRELPKLEHTDVFIDESEIEAAISRVNAAGEVAKEVKANLDAMLAIARTPKKNLQRRLHFHFLTTPIAINGEERVESVRFRRNAIVAGRVLSGDAEFDLKAGLVISAIGYEPEKIAGIPLESGRVVHEEGKVNGTNIYVVGWAKRGPTGVIGTNKSDAAATVDRLIVDLGPVKVGFNLADFLRDRGVSFVSQSGWQLIDNAETAAGSPIGKPRIKFTDREEMFKIAREDKE